MGTNETFLGIQSALVPLTGHFIDDGIEVALQSLRGIDVGGDVEAIVAHPG